MVVVVVEEGVVTVGVEGSVSIVVSFMGAIRDVARPAELRFCVDIGHSEREMIREKEYVLTCASF